MTIRNIRRSITFFIISLLLGILLTGCGGEGASADNEHITGSIELEYADQFSIDILDDEYYSVTIQDGLRYLIIPEGRDDPPEWMSEAELAGYTVIRQDTDNIYLAASSAMDMFRELGMLGHISMTSTKASDWGIDEVRSLVEAGDIKYIGKYSAPDYEAVLEGGTDLVIESTMIYHSPEIKEELESLGIPVMVERSSYESDPLGRLEWIRLYGILTGTQDKADTFFRDAADEVSAMSGSGLTEPPSAAFFSINSGGSVVIRKPGDYVTKMIEMAGGTYVPSDVNIEEENALSTMNMQMEAFYEQAVDADIIFYNSTIEGEITHLSDLTAKSANLADFKAVRNGNVWCTGSNMFQTTTGIRDMIIEMNAIFTGTADEDSLVYFHRVAE